MPTWVDIAVKLTPAFVTLVLGFVASGIAYLQFRISRDKLRLDLFARRLEAYEKLQEYFGCVFRDGSVDDTALRTLWEARYKSRFLFRPDFDTYFENLTKKAIHLQTLGTRLYGPGALPQNEERRKVSDEKAALVIWHMDEMKRVADRYSPYLRFR